MFRRLFYLSSDAGGSAGGSAPAPAAAGNAGAAGSAPTPEAGADPKALGGMPQSLVRKMKVDGQELEVNLGDEKQLEQLLRDAGLAKAGHKRMAEAAEKMRRAEAIIERARKNPIEALLDPALGLTKEQVRDSMEKWYKTNVIDEEAMTPEQKKLRDYEQKLKAYEEKETKEKETKEAEQRTAIETKYQEHYQKQIMATLDKTGLPKTAKTVQRFAFYMSEAIRDGVEVPMDVIAEKVREDYQGELRAFTQAATPEVLLQFLGNDIANKIRKHDLAEHLKRKAGGVPPATPPSPEDADEKEKPKRERRSSWTSVRRNLGR